jgi:hypothetical protein
MRFDLPQRASIKADLRFVAGPPLTAERAPLGLTQSFRLIITLFTFILITSLTKGYGQACNTNDFASAIIIGSSPAANVWYTDRFAPNGFTSQQSGGGRTNVLKHSIAASDGQTTSHENTQGRKYDLPAGSKIIQVDLYIPSDWQTSQRRMAGLWGSAYNVANTLTNESYPIIEFASDGGTPRFQGYESGDGSWVPISLPSGFLFNSWVNLKIELKADKQYIYTVTAANGNVSSITTTTHPNTTEYIGNAILQGHNTTPPGIGYDIYWDNFGVAANKGFVSNVETGELFCTIQTAINDAETLNGHTIKVPAGTYSETITINKSLSLWGAQKGVDPRPSIGSARTIGGSGETIISVTKINRALNINANDVTIDGFQIEQTGISGDTRAIETNVSHSNITFTNNILTNTSTGDAMRLHGGQNFTISQNYLYNIAAQAIWFRNGNALPIAARNQKIINNDIIDVRGVNGGAMNLYGLTDLEISGNRIESKYQGLSIGTTFDQPYYTMYEIDVHHNTILTELPAGSGNIRNAISILGIGENIKIRENIIAQSGTNTTTYPLIRIGLDVNLTTESNPSGVVISDNHLSMVPGGTGKYIDVAKNLTNYIEATCNWFGGATTFSAVSSLIEDRSSTGFINGVTFLTSGTNTLTGGPGFKPETNACFTPVHNITKDTYHSTIQTAINAAANGDEIVADAGTYPENITVNKPLTLKGASKTTTILSGSTDVGIYIDADNVIIENLTVRGASTQGLLTNCGSDNLTITNVAVENSGKSGFNINGVNTATLTNITATNNAGTGISISASRSITIDGVTTVDNIFAGGFSSGVGIFSGGACASSVGGPATNAVTIGGAVNIDEPFAIYQQGSAISGVSLPADYAYFVGVGSNDRYYTDTKGEAFTMASTLIANPTSPLTVYVEEVATGNHYVDDAIPSAGVPGNYSMSVQAAIDYLAAGNKVFVEEGTFNENVIINKSLTIDGASTATSILSGSAGFGVTVASNDVTIQDFTITGYSNGIRFDSPLLSNIKIENIAAKDNTLYGININTGIVSGLTITNTELSGSSAGVGFKVGTSGGIDGMTMTGSTIKDNDQGFAFASNASSTSKVENITISGTTFTNNAKKGIYVEKLSKATFDNITVTNNGIDPNYASNNGISINLLNNVNVDITIKNSTITGNGVAGTSSYPGGRPSIGIATSGAATLTGFTFSGNTITAPSHLLAIGVTGGNLNIVKNNLSGLNPDKYAVINTGAANVNLICNWHGGDVASAITPTLVTTGSGRNILASFSANAAYTTCTPADCDIAAINISDGDVAISSGGPTRTGNLMFTAATGYDSYVWTACSDGTIGSCTVNIPGVTSNILSREFPQIGHKGVKLVKTIGGESQTCYFFFTVNPFITTSSSTACSILLKKNGAAGTNKWYKDNVEIEGVTTDTYTATANGSYVLKVSRGSTVFESPAVVVNLTGAISITTQPQLTQTVCQNAATANLTIASTPAAVSYQWFVNTSKSNVGGTAINGATSATFSPPATTSGTYFYYAVATSGNGCTTTSNVSEVIVTPGPLPGSYVISATETCQGTPITITGSGLLADADTKIFYTLTSPSGSGLPSLPPPFTGIATGGILESNSPTNLIPGTYSVTVTSVEANGCTTPVVSAPTLSWTVSPAVNYALKFGTGNTTVANGNSVTLCKNENVPLEITGTAGQTYTLTRAANAEWLTPIVISGNVGSPAVNLPAQMSWNGDWTLVVTSGSCSETITFDVSVNQPNGLTNIGTNATVAISAGTNDLISNCGFIGTISSTSLAGSTVNVATTEVSGARKYTITPTEGTTYSANLVLYFSQADFNAFNNASDIDIATSSTDLTGISRLRILHKGTSTETIVPSTVAWNGTKSWWEVSFTVSHFSTFELAASNSALPVELTFFKAVKENNTAQLTWATTSESNSDHFDIQHSVNGKNWLSIGKSEAMGENKGIKSYSFNHTLPALGENLYRLKMIDRDGTFAYSSIESVNFGSNLMVTLYPNPVSDRLLIDTQHWKNVSGVKLIDLNGRTVYSSDKGKLTNSIDVKSLASGTYLVEISHTNGQVTASKIVIVR